MNDKLEQLQAIIYERFEKLADSYTETTTCETILFGDELLDLGAPFDNVGITITYAVFVDECQEDSRIMPSNTEFFITHITKTGDIEVDELLQREFYLETIYSN